MWQLPNMTSWRAPRPPARLAPERSSGTILVKGLTRVGSYRSCHYNQTKALALTSPKLSSDLIYSNSSIYHIILPLILSISSGVIIILGICIIPCSATTQLTATPCQQTEGSTDDSTCFAHTCFAHAMLTAVLLANQCLCRAQSIAQMGELSWQ